ncbi:unnamed protein product [Microthlaspi erraticum]|uniref:SWIM-type domain-containing protein n=1 Tax=Microthlaspi erraticum TaxID=1685480 RepID=A0A6D2IKR1_9BRAS|nr:unnamed protein product [Microthlaspi erraticum]
MSGIHLTNILFEVGEYISENGEKARWIPREENCSYSLLFKTCMERISHSVDRICGKISIDASRSKLKLSYISMIFKPRRRVYVVDDEDVQAYLNSTDNEQCRSVLNVEKERVDENAEKERADENAEIEAEEDSEPRVNVDVDDDGENGMNNGMHSSSFDDHFEVPRAILGCDYVDEWDDGMGLEIGQEFPNKKAVQDLVATACHRNCFAIKLVKSDRQRYVVRCSQWNEGCGWYLRTTKVRLSPCFSVRVYTGKHRCSRANASTSMQKTRGTPHLVASVLNEDYAGIYDTPAPKNIMDIVQARLGVKVSYSTALRGKHKAVNDVRGNPVEYFQLIHSYFYMLESVNPGTVTKVKLDANQKFLNRFAALGASIEGFQAMRKVIIVDATSLKTSYPGMLVFATAQDPNHHHYPLAFGIIDSENHSSWGWFFEQLKTVIADSHELVFVSNRHQSIIKSVREVYPFAEHGYCIYHLSQNVKGTVGSSKDECAAYFIRCAEKYTYPEFWECYMDFRSRYPSAAVYLDNQVATDKWARCLFKGVRYDVDTSNVVESMNSVFRKARNKEISPLVENIMHGRCKVASKLIVSEVNSYLLEYSVIEERVHYGVSLLKKSCICNQFDIDKYPCVHAIAAVIALMRSDDRNADVNFHDLVSKYYLMETWVLAY